MVDKDDNDSKRPADDDDDELGEPVSDRGGNAADGSDRDAADDDGVDRDLIAHPKHPTPAPRTGAVERAASRAAHAHDHGLAHITPIKLLVGVFGALTVLTVFTVAVTAVDLGSQGNFVVAMIIATVKAGLVMAFFMHLVWDKKFNLTVFLSSFLFVLLFLSLALTDRNEYQTQIDMFEQSNPLQAETPVLAGSAAPTPAP
ncbi:MAG TPA: cytochrome C oxidase subunit IV family protein [Polyangiaceae bacterium]|nr:cytochrome C oxidase subunit IV family protein [Polyangiaceae bacterium]